MAEAKADFEQKTHSPAALKKRKKILSTALKLFAKEGFHNADVQIIADLAGVGKGTIYRHFGNKHELFLAAARACVEWQAEYIRKSVENARGIAELLRRVAVACAEFYAEHPEAVEIMIQERAEFRESVFPTTLMFRSNTSGGLEAEVREAIRIGHIRPVDPKIAVDAFLDLLYGCALCGTLGGNRRHLVARFEHEVDLLLDGLLLSEPKKRSE
ncbi:MAG TPA: TetR/AcrR family transcriptional regulator [Pirellulales bacterium]|nr:TetR/AcrR family transcriptional regulator [Pirellulales bacterium]